MSLFSPLWSWEIVEIEALWEIHRTGEGVHDIDDRHCWGWLSLRLNVWFSLQPPFALCITLEEFIHIWLQSQPWKCHLKEAFLWWLLLCTIIFCDPPQICSWDKWRVHGRMYHTKFDCRTDCPSQQQWRLQKSLSRKWRSSWDSSCTENLQNQLTIQAWRWRHHL